MVVSTVLQRFMDASPIPVMVRALLERVLTIDRLDELFNRVTKKQYTRDLLFSSVFELMGLVVFKIFPSINAAYQAQKVKINVSLTSVYNKLNGLEIGVPAALVHDTAQELEAVIKELDAPSQKLLPGYRVKMLDGNCLASTQHRLKVLRGKAAGALPGKSLVIFDPELEMVIDVLPCQDGHTQERALLSKILSSVHEKDVLVEDRNFCVLAHLIGIDKKNAFFVCRHHKQMSYRAVSEQRKIGEIETGTVYEQKIEVEDDTGQTYCWRSITIRLHKPTRDGDNEIVILTNLEESVADALKISELYRKRWTIETMFQEIESHLQSEINTLGYPSAALFGFCMALISYNLLAVVKAALRKVHGEEKIKNDVSAYYIAGEISRTHEGMTIVVEPQEWGIFQTMTLQAFVITLLQLAQNVQLEKYKKSRRGPKKPPAVRISSKNEPHVSTARLLLEAKFSP